MSTNNTNSGNASQTLFRFVSLRNPQLTETSRENLNFIFRPEAVSNSYFDQAIANSNPALKLPKIKILENAATNFSPSRDLDTEKNIDSGRFQNLRKLGKALAKKENDIAEALFDDAEQEWNSLQDGRTPEIDFNSELWDNYLYQVITQKNFYTKEALSQILKALHAIYIHSLTSLEQKNQENLIPDNVRPANHEHAISTSANAAIVLPETLFSEETSMPGSVILAKTLSALEEERLQILAEKEISISTTVLKKEKLETLKKEVERLQRNYQKEYTKAYNEAYRDYKDDVQPLIDAYENSISIAEAGFTDRTSEAEKQTAYAAIPALNLPAFEFELEEIDFDSIQNKLSKELFQSLVELISTGETATAKGMELSKNTVTVLIDSLEHHFIIEDDYNSHQKILDKVNEEIANLYSRTLSISEVKSQKFANIGGNLIPVKDSNNIPPRAYFLQAHSQRSLLESKNFLQFGFAVEDETWSVATANINATTDKGTFTEKINDIPVVEGKISFPAMLLNKFETISSLEIQLWFDNGCSCVLEIENPTSNTTYTGFMEIGNQGVVATTTPETFQPQHFGVKRLGIADYLKVEQSVHAYVPGEVSNIENVMASELRHKSSTAREYSEITESTSKFQEVEKISDTTKTSRTDMQTEIARELDKQQSYEANTRFGKSGTWYFEMGGSYANNTAQHDSNRQAVAKSQEITERALERVLTKISEERVEKIIKEYTETNVHEFDNRGKVTDTDNPDAAKPQHITGVYRWVDKKMKNQIYNYGKRTMFEFMIPEPARLHVLATKAVRASFTEPVDPRKSSSNTMTNANVDESILKYWADKYVVTLTELPTKNKQHHIPYEYFKLSGNQEQRFKELNIPENYAAKDVTVFYGYEWGYMKVSDFKGGDISLPYVGRGSIDSNFSVSGLNITDKFLFKFQGFGVDSFNVTFNFNCELSDEFILSWKKEQYNKIITAYEKAKEKFDADVKAANEASVAQEKENLEKKTNFYRDTEANIIKHNCIAYLLQSYAALGQTMSYDKETMQSFKMLFGANLDNYTALAKFMEQAFEWSVMDYTFYPYYWASKAHWQDLYLSEDTDALFRSFLQAGMARVIVTIKPGFENAVQFFMTTGKIWNGGDVPVIGDPLYLSIVDELKQPTGEPQGKYWITRVPTTLTILQDKSTGLSVTQPLPIFPESDSENCENPAELETETSFTQREYHLTEGKDTTTLPKEITNVYNEKIIVQ